MPTPYGRLNLAQAFVKESGKHPLIESAKDDEDV
jgi:hypothetical protein